MKNNLYLVKVSTVWFAYSASVGERRVTKETAANLWKSAYPEHAATIEVIDAPAADANGNAFLSVYGRSYKQTARGFEIHGIGRIR